MENKCYAFLGQKQCRILSVKNCPGCSFFKTIEQKKESLKKAFTRLASLDKVHQDYIADKYYNRKMLWQNGGEGHAKKMAS